MSGPYAKVIADSISTSGVRLSTLEVRMHPSAVEHFLTHRAFSRNGASRRAIPLAKQIQAVLDDPAIPISWGREQKGMKGGERLSDATIAHLTSVWRRQLFDACATADRMGAHGLHKEAASRVLAPFGWRTYVVTATEWDGFFWQRISDGAQDEIRAVATLMQDALVDSEPKPVAFGDWHLPYVDDEDLVECRRLGVHPQEVSAARCARVSYLTQDGRRDVVEDESLFLRLTGSGHWSPLEHVARPPIHSEPQGNLRGWVQLRHLVETGPTVLAA